VDLRDSTLSSKLAVLEIQGKRHRSAIPIIPIRGLNFFRRWSISVGVVKLGLAFKRVETKVKVLKRSLSEGEVEIRLLEKTLAGMVVQVLVRVLVQGGIASPYFNSL